MENQITNIEEIKETLSTIDPQDLMYAISQMNNIYVPQSYFTKEHANQFGFESIEQMKKIGKFANMHTHVDESMSYLSDEIETYNEYNS